MKTIQVPGQTLAIQLTTFADAIEACEGFDPQVPLSIALTAKSFLSALADVSWPAGLKVPAGSVHSNTAFGGKGLQVGWDLKEVYDDSGVDLLFGPDGDIEAEAYNERNDYKEWAAHAGDTMVENAESFRNWLVSVYAHYEKTKDDPIGMPEEGSEAEEDLLFEALQELDDTTRRYEGLRADVQSLLDMPTVDGAYLLRELQSALDRAEGIEQHKDEA